MNHSLPCGHYEHQLTTLAWCSMAPIYAFFTPTSHQPSSASMAFSCILVFFLATLLSLPSLTLSAKAWPSSPPNNTGDGVFGASKANEGSSAFVHMRYHMGPVLTSTIHLYIIWYGSWPLSHKSIIKGFLQSISAPPLPAPSVHSWWSTVQLYTDQTGANISNTLRIAGESTDLYSLGKNLTRMSVQQLIKASLLGKGGSLPVDPNGGIYLVLTADDVVQQDFCRAVCGFHYFTYPSIVGYTLPYAWVGNSGKQCPDTCAYPFALPSYMGDSMKPLKAPNGDIGVDGMVSVIGHEIAEMSSNPLINAWYAGEDPTAPTEIADLCEGIYGSGGGGSYTGMVSEDKVGASYNMKGIRGRKYLVQWLWSPVLSSCAGPNVSQQ